MMCLFPSHDVGQGSTSARLHVAAVPPVVGQEGPFLALSSSFSWQVALVGSGASGEAGEIFDYRKKYLPTSQVQCQTEASGGGMGRSTNHDAA